MDIEIAIALLTEIRMRETAELTAIDPSNQKSVDRENAQAMENFEYASDFVAIGKLDKGLREYANAWQHAIKAEKEALKLPTLHRGDGDPQDGVDDE